MIAESSRRIPRNWFSRQALLAHGDSFPQALGHLDDGTPYYAPIGVLVYDPGSQRVRCHLCGHWYRSVGRHAWKWHGWKRAQYVEAFGLAQRRALCTPTVSKQQSKRMKEIYVGSPEVRENLSRGQALLRDPEVRKQWRKPRDTAHRPERLRTLESLMHALQQSQKDRAHERRQQRLLELGFHRVEDYLTDRYAQQQMPLRAIRDELGASHEFVSRALDQLGLKQAAGVPGTRAGRVEARRRWRLRELGFDSFEEYVRNRYVERAMTTPQIARELGVHYRFVSGTLREAGISLRAATQASLSARSRRRAVIEGAIAERLGFPSFKAYLDDRVARGIPVADIAREAQVRYHFIAFACCQHGVLPAPYDHARHRHETLNLA